jgi:lambda family phage portal protein
MKSAPHWLDRITAPVAPIWTLKRQRARLAARHYEAASTGRRTANWYRNNTDANAALGPALAYLRATARDLVRNNPYAESALTTIVDHMVGTGIVAKVTPKDGLFAKAWKAWSETTACDADGRNDLAGLQALVARTVAESGECLVRRRWRRTDDGFPLNFQLQVLEPDFLDTSKNLLASGNSGGIAQGVEFDLLGRRVAYWLFPQHPGSGMLIAASSYRVDARDVRHVFRGTRPGQVRAASWFANVLLTFKDFDEFEDATLMKQKIAACLAVITSDVDGTGVALGTADDTGDPPIDTLAPGMVLNVPAGKTVDVVSPPSAGDYEPYSKVQLRKIATGLGIAYEDLTGDYTGMPYSAARMSRLRHWARVDGWRWKMLIPQFCTPVMEWAIEAGRLQGLIPLTAAAPSYAWTAPPPPMIEPDKEGLAIMRLRRAGVKSLGESIREMGYDAEEVFAQIAEENAMLDTLGIVTDSDPRKMTAQGQAQQSDAAAQSIADDKKQAAKQPPEEPADA